LAIRQCLELGLHKQRGVDSRNVQLDQHRKRLFWSTYIFERKTALVLGRPFALSDEEIDLDLPMSVNDDDKEERNLVSTLGVDPSLQQTERTTLSYHRFHVELYQIHTEIRLSLHRLKKTSGKEQSQQMISTLFGKLESWRTKVLDTYPTQTQRTVSASRSSNVNRIREHADSGSDLSGNEQEVQHRPTEVEKSELLLEYHKARRSFLQPLMTEGRDNFPFDTADYTACADASGQICQLYRRLHRLSPIPFSLRDLHAVFVAGFTLIYCICTCPSIYSAQRAADVGACSTVLYVISEQWSSAKKYRDAFEVVAEKMTESTRKYHESSSAEFSHSFETHQSGNNSTWARRIQKSLSRESNVRSSDMNAQPEHHNAGVRLSSNITNEFVHQLTPQPESYNGTIFPETGDDVTFHNESHATMWNTGLELDLNLEYDIYGIEGLLSNEGLDWFTGAVL
jgi:Fungal specific transcription factor domain